ncbi:MAG: PH domain-containing protein [Armatimonadetes bacterium]|nr:MAG: PH domain-containing protein [Armatimonadota bacterium]
MKKAPYSQPATEKQKKKFNHYLNDDEEMIIFTTVSPAYLLHKFMLHFLLASLITIPIFFFVYIFFRHQLIGVLGIAILLSLVYAAVRYYLTKEGIQYILTNKRLIVQVGYFQVTLYSANYNKIAHIEVVQNFLERLFYKHGKIIVQTAGTDKKPITLDYIEYPLVFKNIMERLIHQERRLYRVD